MTRFLAFDLETSKITPEGDDPQSYRPLGICCWAVAWVGNDGNIMAWSDSGRNDEGQRTSQMDSLDCTLLIDLLINRVRRGYTLLGHNTVGFDLDILAEESGMHAECADLAMNSVDTCLLTMCHKGFPVGLDAISKGFGLAGKTEGMSGGLAPIMWSEGRFDEVLAYCAQDVRTTLEVALEIEKRGCISWIAKSGRLNHLRIPKLLTVQEALLLPEPDVSWMKDREPIRRSRFIEWMKL